jgi:hypothetical protein
MGYDLFFRSPKAMSRETVGAWLARQPNAVVYPDSVLFENELTGVHFTFQLGRDGLPSFHAPYGRAAFFGKEAALLLASFVSELGLSVSDPQRDGMGDGEYSIDGFLKGWNAGNEWAHRAFVRDHPELPDAPSLPKAVNDWMWAWNFSGPWTSTVLEAAGIATSYVCPVAVARDAANEIWPYVAWSGLNAVCFPAEIDRILTRHRDATHAFTPATLLGVVEPKLRWPARDTGQGARCPAAIVMDKLKAQKLVALMNSAKVVEVRSVPLASVLDRELVVDARAQATSARSR